MSALLTGGPSGAGLKVVSDRNMSHRTHQKYMAWVLAKKQSWKCMKPKISLWKILPNLSSRM